MKEKLKIGILYLGLHNQLVKKYGVNTIITRKELFCKLGRHAQLPKSLRHYVVDEMEKVNLIEKVNRDNIKILKSDIDIEKEQNKLYNMINL